MEILGYLIGGYVYTIVIVYLLLCIFAGVLANSRGRLWEGWIVIAFFFNPILIMIVLMCMEDLKKKQLYFDSFNQFQCPYCLERINRGSQICRFCKSDVSEFIGNTKMDESNLGGVGMVIRTPPNIKFIVIGFFVGFGILGYSIYDTHENGESNLLLILLSVGILIRMVLELTRIKSR